MPVLRCFRYPLALMALALVVLAAPIDAEAQSLDRDVPRGGGDVHGGGGGFRGGGFRGGLGVLPGLLGGAIIAGSRAAAQPDRGRPPHQRKYIAQPQPPREKIRIAQPRPARPDIVTRRAEAPPKVFPGRLARGGGQALHQPPSGEKRFLPHEILVVFAARVADKHATAITRRHRLELVQIRDLTLIGMRVRRYRFSDDRSVEAILGALAREKTILLLEPHYLFALQQDSAQSAPESAAPKLDTPSADKPADSPLPSYSSALLHLPEAHKIATGRGVRVAVIDSLIDFAHPEILDSIAASFDPLEGAKAQPQLHGTGMASAIAGHRQIDGAAPNAQILAVRAFGETDVGVRAAGLDILAGIDWAAAQKAQVINMSFAGPLDPLLSLMLAAAAERKIALIAAAGNEGPEAPPQYPAADPHVIAVSAIDAQAQVYPKANRGPYVALAAPGVDVLVAAPSGAYDMSTGTSVACAEVSGIAALLLEKKPDLDGPELRRLLQKSARAFDGVSGAGAGAADAETAIEGVQ